MTTNSSLKVGCLLPTIERNIDQDRINSYAEASGDFNPIHIDTQYAKETDFRGTIAHGMMIAATISELMTKTFGIAWFKTGTMKIRFKAPVYPEDIITTSGQIHKISDAQEIGETVLCRLEISRQTGEIAIQATTEVEILNH